MKETWTKFQNSVVSNDSTALESAEVVIHPSAASFSQKTANNTTPKLIAFETFKPTK